MEPTQNRLREQGTTTLPPSVATALIDNDCKPLNVGEIEDVVRNLPALPGVVVELLATLRDNDASLDRMAELIATDQSLAARALRLANSPFYGMPRKVTSIAEAIALVGVASIRTIVLAASLPGHFRVARKSGFDLDRFWRHSISAAIAAKSFAHLHGGKENDAFVAVLLHDIGKLVLAIGFPDRYALVLSRLRAHEIDPREIEAGVFATDHTVVGGLLAQRWNLPTQIVSVISDHHNPDLFEEYPLTAIVYTANYLVRCLEHPDDPIWRGVALDICGRRLGVTEEQLDAILASTADQVEALYTSLAQD
ncbi:MAG: HDOD domain-containing protein [Burkholderiales bacterium]|nr:HDOD domain-containing protein [Burkholderiales bacterium]